MCPLQVELVYCLQASWRGRGEPPKVDHISLSFHQSRLNRDQRSQIYYWPIKYTSRSYLDIVGVCEEHGETINTHAPTCCGWKAILQRSAEGLIDEHRLIVAFCLGLWKQ